jgi:YCII-related domain
MCRIEAAAFVVGVRQETIPMAQYLISVLDDDTTHTGTAEEMAAVDVFNEQLRAGGHWVFAGGLASPGTATVIDGRAGEAVFTDGPYLETKEYVAGFWISWPAGEPGRSSCFTPCLRPDIARQLR